MTTKEDYTTRIRNEIYSIYVAYQTLVRRIDDLSDEVTALGGAEGIYGVDGVDWPEQGDGFEYSDITAAFTNLTALVGEASLAEKQTIIKCRRD